MKKIKLISLTVLMLFCLQLVAFASEGDIYINYLEIVPDDTYTILHKRYEDTNVEFDENKTYIMSNISGYDYVGYTIVNRNVTTISRQNGLKRSEKAVTQVNNSNPVRTINFLYTKKTGTIKVRNIMLYADNTYKEIPGHTKTYKNLSLGSYDYEPTYKSDSSSYKGYTLEDGLVSTKNYTLNDRKYKDETNVTIKLKDDVREKTLTFVFFDERFEKLGVGITFEHYNSKEDYEIYPTDRVTRDFDDFSDFMNSIYKDSTNKGTIAQKYNEIVKSEKSIDEKICEIFELIKNDLNEDVYSIKSFNTLNPEFMRYTLMGVTVRTKKSKSEYDVDYEYLDNGIQVMPKIKDLIKVCEKREFFSKNEDPKLIITFVYDADSIVTVNYANGDIHSPKHGSTDNLLATKNVSVKLNSEGRIEIPAINNYVFKDFNCSVSNARVEGNTVIIPSVRGNGTLTLNYYPSHNVTINLKDGKTGEMIEYPVNPTTGEYIENPATLSDVLFGTSANFEISRTLKNGNLVSTFDPKLTKAVDESGAPVEIINNNTNITIPEVKNNTTIDVFYNQSQSIIVNYVDTNNRTKTVYTEKISVASDKTSTTVTARSSVRGTDGASYMYAGSYDVTPTSSGTSGSGSNSVKVKVEEGTTVTFYCKKAVGVTVNYYDESTGKRIKTSKTESVDNGKDYSYKVENINGYSYSYYNTGKDTKKNTSKDISLTKITEAQTINVYYYPRAGIDFKISASTSNNQIADSSAYSKNENIVLDDVFAVTIEVNNYKNAEADTKLYLKFPFDVFFIEGGFTNGEGDFLECGKEILIDTLLKGVEEPEKSYTYMFRLPSWTKEQDYEDGIELLVKEGSKDAESITKSVTVVGRVYKFTITNLVGDTNWKDSMFTGKNANREYTADLLPIGQREATTNANSKVAMQGDTKAGIKLGSSFLFKLSTKGLKTNNIVIEPKLTFVDDSGMINNDVTYKYLLDGEKENEFANKFGVVTAQGIESKSYLSTTLGNDARKTSDVTSEITKANEFANNNNVYIGLSSAKEKYANVLNVYKNFSSSTTTQFGTFARLSIGTALRMPNLNYVKSEVNKIGAEDNTLRYVLSSQENKIYTDKASKVSMTEDEIIDSLSHWYAEYKLPASLKVCDSEGNEFTKGYVIVSFKISTLDADGKEYLAYESDSTNEWKKENTNLSSSKVQVKLPVTEYGDSNNVSVDIGDGYYPVAVYEVGQRLDDGTEKGEKY